MKESDRNIQSEELLAYKKRLAVAVRAAKICIFEVDIVRQLYTFFENSEAIFGVSGEKILSEVQPYSKLSAEEYQRSVTDYFVHPDDTQTVAAAFESVFAGKPTSYEARMKAGEGAYTWCKVDITLLAENDGTVKMIGIISDIQKMRDTIDNLTLETELDSFTKLYSKKRFEELCRGVLREKNGGKSALLMLDLDNFKMVNDTYGHQRGDEVLLSVAQHLKNFFRRQDIIARFGGDEFVVLMRGIPSVDAVREKLGKLVSEHGNAYGVTKSIGAAVYPDTAEDFDSLLRAADKALYEAKKVKNSYKIC